MFDSNKILLLFKCLCYLVAFFLPIYFWYPMLGAKWGLIDDHEILNFIGPYSSLPIGNIADTLSSTELAWNSGTSRFRPSYYFLRIFESVVWGKDASLWYGFRMVVSILFSISLVRLSIIMIGPVIGLGFLLFASTQLYWVDIFANAGPSEVYGVLGCTMLIMALSSSINLVQVSTYKGLLIALGVAIAFGSKENLIFLAAVPLYILFNKNYTKTIGARILLSLSLLFIAYTTISLYLRLKGTQVDIYQNDTSFWLRIGLLKAFMLQKNVLLWILSVCSLSFICFFICKYLYLPILEKAKQLTTLNIKFLKYQLLLILMYASQYIFYAGKWPIFDSRYYFPGVLAFDFGMLIVAIFVLNIIKIIINKKYLELILQSLVLVILTTIAAKNFSENHARATHRAQVTKSFDEKFSLVLKVLVENPQLPLIIMANHPTDYEPIFAINRFLYSYSIQNPLGVKINDEAFLVNGSDDPQIKWLKEAINDLSLNGAHSKRKDLFFDPINSFDQSTCISVGLSGPPVMSCKYGAIRLWN
jgi:hypothetical protein